MENKILKRICPKCKKILSSLSKSQLEYNFEQHLQKHERREKNIILKRIEDKEKEND